MEGNPKQVAKAAEMINEAERPVLYIGGGIISSGVITSYSIHYTKLYEKPFCSQVL